MCQHHPFGESGSTAGIGQRHQIFGRIYLHLRNVSVAVEQRVKGGGTGSSAKHKNLFNSRLSRSDLCLLQKRRHGYQKAGAGVLKLMTDFPFRIERVNERGDSSE